MSPAGQSFRFRASRRVLHEAPVRLVLPGGDGGGGAAAEAGSTRGAANLDLRTRDIAAGGMFVAASEPLAVGSVARFVLHLGSAAAPDDVRGEATVIWTRAAADGDGLPAGMGMQFSGVAPAGQERLARLLSEWPESDVPPPASVPVAALPESVPPTSSSPLAQPVEEPAASVGNAGGEPVREEPMTFAEANLARLVEADSPLPLTETTESDAQSSAPREDDAPPADSPPASPADPGSAAADQADSARTDREPEPAPADPVPAAPAPADEPRVDMFGTLAAEDDEWMKPESKSRAWPWVALAAAVVAVALVAFWGPLMRVVGVGGAPPVESAPEDPPRFDISSARTASDAAADDAEAPITADGPRAPSEDAASGEDSPAVADSETAADMASGEDSATVADSATAADAPTAADSATGADLATEPREPRQTADDAASRAASRDSAGAGRAEHAAVDDSIAAPATTPDAPAPAGAQPATAAGPGATDPAAAAPTLGSPSTTEPVAPAAAERAAAPPAAPPTNATALRSITASTRDGRTWVEIVGNAPFRRHHAMTLEAPPRLVVRLIGVQQDYDARAVRAPRMRGIRTGVHGVGATRNLHVVIDLVTPDIVTTVERQGAAVVVSLSD